MGFKKKINLFFSLIIEQKNKIQNLLRSNALGIIPLENFNNYSRILSA